jgi:metacaspase-1
MGFLYQNHTAMPKGFSLHIGINEVDANRYRDFSPSVLQNCINDANDCMQIANHFRFDSARLCDAEADSQSVLRAISMAARYLEEGDMFFLTFSGHGSYVNDLNGDESDHKDETWCLYDRQLVDDELFRALTLFKPGVRVLVLAASCHSGSSIKDIEKGRSNLSEERIADMRASCILISACQDDQFTPDSPDLNQSLFIHCLLRVLRHYEFCDSYQGLYNKIYNMMPVSSKPNLLYFGPGAKAFVRMRPFLI